MNGPPVMPAESLEARVARLEQIVVFQARTIRTLAGDAMGLVDGVALRDIAKGFPIRVNLPPAQRGGG